MKTTTRPMTDQQKQYIHWLTNDYAESYKAFENRALQRRTWWRALFTCLGLVFVGGVAGWTIGGWLLGF